MKTKMKYDPEAVQLRYMNWLDMMINIMKPKNLYIYVARGGGKTQSILAHRTQDVCKEMPGGVFSFVADTFINALTNIIPNIIIGWKRNGWLEHDTLPGHFILDKKPPVEFKKNDLRLTDYNRTISTYNGCLFLLKSLDRPSMNAGISVLHRFGDETKYFREQKIKKTAPTLRGDRNEFGNSPYFMGTTFTSDLPNLSDGEFDWMTQMEFNADKKLNYNLFQFGLMVNEIEYELYEAIKNEIPPREIQLIKDKLERWKYKFNLLRRRSTFYYIASALVNIDILTFDYLINNYQSLSYEEFKTAILSCKPSLERGQRFYTNLNNDHFYQDSYNYDRADSMGIKEFVHTSFDLRYIVKEKPIDAGYDGGNMMSLVFGQEQGSVYRVFKCLHTLSPEWIRELADKFIDFFAQHKTKVLNLYYDRAANNYRKAKKDWASELKASIEFNVEGRKTGWQVNLMSIGQGDISMAVEYNFMTVLMSGKEKRLPILKICSYECKELKSSLELAEAKTVMKAGKKVLIKVKTSEKKKLSDLPMHSTNMSDAFKYLMCRRNYLQVISNSSTPQYSGSVSIL